MQLNSRYQRFKYYMLSVVFVESNSHCVQYILYINQIMSLQVEKKKKIFIINLFDKAKLCA